VNNERPSGQLEGLLAPLSELPWSSDFVMQAIEILVVSRREEGLVCLRPGHAPSFVIGWPAGARPEQVAAKALTSLGLMATVLHSTSWRHAGTEVVLTYLAVVAPDAPLPESWELAPIAHAELARGGATTPPPVIGIDQVLEHALRHLSWLLGEDEAMITSLPGWREALFGYSPEPFRALGGPPVG
jgi:hypothetical protein